ncbi:cytoplasmic protein [Lysinibacillus sp. NPDC047702]|uniref:cytoplasmic protein n=1 Tax=unclassified Lysinibacillus TaxID=2636778 RepID=UPI003D00DE09
MAEKQLSPQERAMLFSQGTRQTFQTLGSIHVTGEGTRNTFTLPKSRLLSKIWLEVEAEFIIKSEMSQLSTKLSPLEVLRRVEVNLNNGFSPFILSGRDLHLYTMNRQNPVTFGNFSTYFNEKKVNHIETQKTADLDKPNKMKFMCMLPLTLNDRDAVGLVLLQNEETVVNVNIDVGQIKDVFIPNNTSDEVIFKSMVITPMLETYTIPPSPLAFPDLSVLKIVQSKEETFNANTTQTVKLNTGTIYRKMVMYFEDEHGRPVKEADFIGNMELVFNTADVPFSIKPSILRAKNAIETYSNEKFEDGVYLFDFSNQGLPNLGGSRDYIDTERLTEFWLRFTCNKVGKVTVISETLSRLM